jgi:hypothetical protein
MLEFALLVAYLVMMAMSFWSCGLREIFDVIAGTQSLELWLVSFSRAKI